MKQVTAILLGAGQRGMEVYAAYALHFPNEFKITGVAEPKEERREAFKKVHGIADGNCVSDWKELLNRPKMADCVIIATQDNEHYEPYVLAARKGYHILCEKPMSSDKNELKEMAEIAGKSEQIISICHVLRYSPFFSEIKRLLEQKAIGELVSIQHMESVGYWHMAHSFVRGNWNNKENSSSMILQKCCHDMDILLWLAGSECSRVSSFGSLSLFKEENAPIGAPAYCMDGCEYREECPYYAPKFYLEHPKAIADGFAKVVSMDTSREGLLSALDKGPYGRCVFHCDNNVVDHQVVNLEYTNGVTASFTMCAFTEKCERVINLMGTKGQILGNMEENRLEIRDFATGHHTNIELHVPSGGHSGSDESMMREFVSLVARVDKKGNRNGAVTAARSHLIALAAEESRQNGGTVIQL